MSKSNAKCPCRKKLPCCRREHCNHCRRFGVGGSAGGEYDPKLPCVAAGCQEKPK